MLLQESPTTAPSQAPPLTISPRAIAFAWSVSRMMSGNERIDVDRRSIEQATLLDHTRWDWSACDALGIVYTPGRWSAQGGAAGSLARRGQFAPTYASTTFYLSSALALLEPQRSTSTHDDARTWGQTVRADLVDPVDEVWDVLGGYRWAWWVVYVATEGQDVEVSVEGLVAGLGISERTARRMMAKAREAGYLQGSTWYGERMVSALAGGISARTRRMVARPSERRYAQHQAYLDWLDTLEVRDGFRRPSRDPLRGLDRWGIPGTMVHEEVLHVRVDA
jgi:hypothetical protein